MSRGTSAGQFRAPQTSSAMDRNLILCAPSLFSAGVSGGKPCRDEGEWNIVSPNTQFKIEWGCHQAHMWARPPFKCGPCHSSTLLQPISMTINVSGPKRSNPSIEVAPLSVSHCVSPQWPASIDVCHQHFIVSCSASLQSASVVLIEINDNLGQLSKTKESLGGSPPSIWTSIKTKEICSTTSSGKQM